MAAHPSPAPVLALALLTAACGSHDAPDRIGSGHPPGHHPGFLTITIVCDDVGRTCRLQDHEIHWEIGPEVLDSEVALRARLEALYRNRSAWRRNEETGQPEPPLLLIDAREDVVFADVTRTLEAIDAAVPAGGKEFGIQFRGPPPRPGDPPEEIHRLEPDEHGIINRPILDVDQRGRVIWKKKLDYDPQAPRNDEALRELLDVIAQVMAKPDEEKRIRPGSGADTRIHAPLLVRADQWTRWRHIERVAGLCSASPAVCWHLELVMTRYRVDAPPPVRCRWK